MAKFPVIKLFFEFQYAVVKIIAYYFDVVVLILNHVTILPWYPAGLLYNMFSWSVLFEIVLLIVSCAPPPPSHYTVKNIRKLYGTLPGAIGDMDWEVRSKLSTKIVVKIRNCTG